MTESFNEWKERTENEVPWAPYSACPCGCGVIGWKQTKPLRDDPGQAHVVGCKCRPHIGRRNRSKGQASEARAHKQMGGVGGTVRDDLFHLYSLNHSLENKSGEQIPATFRSFIQSKWTRDALRQAEKKIPVGSDALPTLRIELSPSVAYLVVDISGRKLR